MTNEVVVNGHAGSLLSGAWCENERVESGHREGQLRSVVTAKQPQQPRNAIAHRLGAQVHALADLHDPMRIISILDEPLLAPLRTELDGYVPNVVYSCGSMRAGNNLMIPFGIADQSIGIAVAQLDDLLERLT